MLKEIRIQNIILVESEVVSFERGLNILSGETGSGKSAIMETLRLIGGDRADTSLVRQGCDKGVVEALFDIQNIPALFERLEKHGIDHDKQDDLIIKREIAESGKSRNFINNQAVSLNLLKEIGCMLFDIVGQHASRRLFETEEHRKILDLFGDLEGDLHTFLISHKKQVSLCKELEELKTNETARMRDLDRCRMEFEELEKARIKEGEEEVLFSEYTRLSLAETLSQKADEIIHYLSNDERSVLGNLKRTKQLLVELCSLDASLQETVSSFKNAALELEEIAYSMTSYQNSIEFNPHKMKELDDRLSLINKMRKKYGPSAADVLKYFDDLETKLETLENADFTVETLEKDIHELKKENDILAGSLTEKRKIIARSFEKKITKHLNQLNMKGSEFFVSIVNKARSQHGDDHVEFLLRPNVGEKIVSLKECASGGELSRLLLSIQTLMSEKEKIPTLVFDEIDANIGGETATVVGTNLKEIGQNHQVICVTHFPQVAKHADHHLSIAKKTQSGRTFTQIQTLDVSERKKELARMSGGQEL